VGRWPDASMWLVMRKIPAPKSMEKMLMLALLGILYMNIQAFSMVSAAYMNPTA
jgi:hypothetical protein